MNINEKIRMAANMVAMYEDTRDFKELRNDAANIYADNYEEYMTIWNALQVD